MPEVRLIDANALKDRLPTFAGMIDEQPTIEPERKKGHINICNGFECCSECGKCLGIGYTNYCGYCGAELEVE